MAAIPTLGVVGRGGTLTLSLHGDFRGRSRFTKIVREAVRELLLEVQCAEEAQSAGTIVAQELTENLVKYSASDDSSLTVAVTRIETGAEVGSGQGARFVRLVVDTINDAERGELDRARRLLADVAQCSDLAAFYQEHLAASATRERSELGWLRLLVEAAMSVRLNVVGNRAHVHTEGDLRTTDRTQGPIHETPRGGEGKPE